MPFLNRRRFIELGTTATAAALAGCWRTNQTPSYTEWIPATAGSTLTGYIDLTVSAKTSKIDPVLPLILPSSDDTTSAQFTPNLSGLDEIDDPLLKLPLKTGGQVIATSALSLVVSGLGYLIDLQTPSEGVTELLIANQTTIGTGEIDVARADKSLRNGREGAFGEINHETVSETGEFTIYEPSTDVDAAVALSDSGVIVADTRSKVRTAIETWRGNRNRAVDDNDTYEWLSNTVGSGDLLVGWDGPVQLADYYWESEDPSLVTDIVTQQVDVFSSLTFAPESRKIRTDLALQSDDVERMSRAQLKAQFGMSKKQGSLSINGNRLSVTTTLSEDDLDVDVVQSAETTAEPTVQSSNNQPEKISEAIPDNAIEFSHRAEQDLVRVNFVKEFDADKVTIRALESGSETSTTTPRSVSYLTVYAASGGDEVVVTATIDGVSGEIAREDVP
ncbi:hypothetical protein ACFR9U_15985 [Halorientalis brevis]|uniref:Uncharacterized protein n=1 Tax=Halorientalis brevis TaxID=1126241 RepID=A0ABD6CDX8_9EURY|nr:hypothetical protein [Halorientalis brevis]